jgi:predicted enzyme related to lactoylglutathione lyase
MEFGDGYIFAMPGGPEAPGCGFRLNPPEGTPQTVAYINTADIDQSIADVQAAGGTVVVEKTAIEQVGFVAFFKDPSDNIVGLHQPPTTPEGSNGAQ